jgi:hypothetical protein
LYIVVGLAPAFAADEAPEDVSTAGACSPVVVSSGGTVAIDIKCPTNIVSNFSYRLDASIAQLIASRFNVTEEAVNNFFKQINEENIPPYMVAQRLEQLAVEIIRLRKELASISVSGSSRLLWTQAVKAMEDGQIDLAIKLHQQLVTDSTPDLEKAFATVLDSARVKRSLGELYVLTYKYDAAAQIFEDAAEALPQRYNIEYARLKTLLAEAISLASDKKGFALATREAVSLTRPIQDKEPELYLRALAVLLRVTLNQSGAKAALDLFNNEISPLLDRDDLIGSQWGVLCFSCAGKAFLDLKDNRGAVTVLERGVEFAKKRVAPDKVSLAAIYTNLSIAYGNLGETTKRDSALDSAKQTLTEAFPDEGHPDFVYIYLNLAVRASNARRAKDAEAAYLKAFDIAARLLPYTHGTYKTVLANALEQHGGTLRAGTVVINIGVDLSDEFYAALYERHMSNVKSATQDREAIAGASVDFAAALASNDQLRRSVPYYEKTIALYSDGGVGRNLAVAKFELAQIMDFGGLSDDYQTIEDYYKQSLQIFVNILGNMNIESQHVRLQLVDFYLKHSKANEAAEVVRAFEASVDSGNTSADARRYLIDLSAKMLGNARRAR